jgi:hypothetical protein
MGTAPSILNLGTRRSEWLASLSGRFASRERACGGRLIGGWIGYATHTDALEKTEIPCPCREMKNVLRSSSLWSRILTDCTTPAPYFVCTCAIRFKKQQRTLVRHLGLSSPERRISAIGCTSLYDDAPSIH